MKLLSKQITILIGLSFFLSTAFAAEKKDRSDLPITIKSNELSADNVGKMAVFSGKVMAKQGDITIYSDKLIVRYGDSNKDVEKIEAIGNVRIVQANRTGVAQSAIYDSKAGKIVLSGSPKVIQGDDTVSGKIITYYIDSDKSVVSGGSDSRVEAVIHPPNRGNNVEKRH